jgi:hypothetical protein
MKAITVARYGQWKFKATDGDGNAAISADFDGLSDDQRHDAAAVALCHKMRWAGSLTRGELLKGGRIVARVYVWSASDERNVTTITVKGDSSK